MAKLQGRIAMDSVCKVAQHSDLAKTLNTLRTVPGARNPFVVSQRNEASSGSASGNASGSSGAQAKHK